MTGATFRKWYFSRRGWILAPAYAVFVVVFPAGASSVILEWSAGFSLLLVALALRLWCTRYIGRSFATRQEKAKHLITEGPYALVRNPLYISNIVASVGMCLLADLPFYVPILLVYLAAHYSIVIRCEESFLAERFGDDYRRYMRHVPRWLPRRLVPPRSRPPLDLREAYEVLHRRVTYACAVTVLLASKHVWLTGRGELLWPALTALVIAVLAEPLRPKGSGPLTPVMRLCLKLASVTALLGFMFARL